MPTLNRENTQQSSGIPSVGYVNVDKIDMLKAALDENKKLNQKVAELENELEELKNAPQRAFVQPVQTVAVNEPVVNEPVMDVLDEPQRTVNRAAMRTPGKRVTAEQLERNQDYQRRYGALMQEAGATEQEIQTAFDELEYNKPEKLVDLVAQTLTYGAELFREALTPEENHAFYQSKTKPMRELFGGLRRDFYLSPDELASRLSEQTRDDLREQKELYEQYEKNIGYREQEYLEENAGLAKCVSLLEDATGLSTGEIIQRHKNAEQDPYSYASMYTEAMRETVRRVREASSLEENSRVYRRDTSKLFDLGRENPTAAQMSSMDMTLGEQNSIQIHSCYHQLSRENQIMVSKLMNKKLGEDQRRRMVAYWLASEDAQKEIDRTGGTMGDLIDDRLQNNKGVPEPNQLAMNSLMNNPQAGRLMQMSLKELRPAIRNAEKRREKQAEKPVRTQELAK